MEAQACLRQVARRGPVGAGAEATAQRAPQEGPRPFLSALPTAQSSCACAKGKLRFSKTKTPKEELPQGPWKAAGPPPPPQGHLGGQPGCREARRVTALQPPRGLWAALFQWMGSQTSWDPAGVGAGRRPQGPPAPMPWTWAAGQVVGSPRRPHCTHPASGRRSSQRSPHPGPPGTSA